MNRRNQLVKAAILAVGFSAGAISAAAAAGARGDSVPGKPGEELKNLIVMIRSTPPEGEEEVGAGIIFSQQGNNLYIVTANHVVRQATQEFKARVELRWLPGEPLEAKLLDSFDAVDDWAVLKVANADLSGLPPEGLSFAQLGDPNALERGDQVFLIGNPAGHGWEVSVTPDGVTEKPASTIRFESQHLQPGHSGGGLLDDHMRLVGMLKASQASYGEAVNLQVLKDRLAERYNVKLAPRTDVSAGEPPEAKESKSEQEANAAGSEHGGEQGAFAVYAAKGEAMAKSDRLVAAVRGYEPPGASRRGFDIGMGACEGQTEWGPGKQKLLDSLSPAEQIGFKIAWDFTQERNKNIHWATIGAEIAASDPELLRARFAERPGLYTVGFDIATGIFGDPAKGAQGNTAVGPGAQGIRDKLSAAGQRGFDASVKLHLSRNYRR